LLVQAATQSVDQREAEEASDTFISLFTIYLSGTHATIEQRLGVIERLLRSGEAEARALGLVALGKALEATHFSSNYRFEFGARSRDYGYRPQSDADVTRWYRAALMLIERLALTEGLLKRELRDLVAKKFRGLWTSAQMCAELERLSHKFTEDGFWREGWAACRQTMHYDRGRLMPNAALRLSALATDLRPSNLPERVRAIVLGHGSSRLDLEDMDIEGDHPLSESERLEAIARQLGAEVAADQATFEELLPDLFRGGSGSWAFGRGLAAASPDPRTTWARLAEELEQIPMERRNVQVLKGFLAELWVRNRELVQHLLDSAVDQPL
jgi:hypothetical protein